MSQFFASGDQIIGASASASVLPKNIFFISPSKDWFPLGLTGSPCSPRDSQESPPTPQFKSINSLALSFLHSPTLASIHDSWKTIALTIWIFLGKVISLLFNMLSRFVIAFLPRSKNLLILWLQPPSAVILETKKIKSVTVSLISLSICPKVMGPETMILVFWRWILSQLFHSPILPSSRGS